MPFLQVTRSGCSFSAGRLYSLSGKCAETPCLSLLLMQRLALSSDDKIKGQRSKTADIQQQFWPFTQCLSHGESKNSPANRYFYSLLICHCSPDAALPPAQCATCRLWPMGDSGDIVVSADQ